MLFRTIVALPVVAAVTPVQKVVEMMNNMLAKGQADMQEEQAIMKKYNDWAHDENRDTKLLIGRLNDDIDRETAKEAKASAEVDRLADVLEDLNEDLDQFTKELAEATAVREDENAKFQAAETDFKESVDAIGRALTVLKRHANSKIEALSLIQDMAKTTSSSLKGELVSFLQQPQAKQYGYESQSGGIVEMLKKLQKKFDDQLFKAQSAESNQKHNFQLMKSNLDDEIKNTNAALTKNSEEKAGQSAIAAAAKKAHEDASVELSDNEKALADLNTTHAMKSETFANNQKVRKEEIEALTKAIEIISGNPAESADKHLPTLVQKSTRPVAFLQIKQKTAEQKRNIVSRVAAMLQQKNRLTLGNKSTALSLAAVQMAAGGPFDKVINMVKSLIARLEEEAAAEAEHKAFCDKELKENAVKRNKKTADVEKGTTTDANLGAQIAKLADEIAAKTAEEAALQKAMAEATEIRTAEKAKNTATIKDAKAAQAALSQALEVLQSFYSSQGESFIQQAPEMKAYTGQKSSSGGVIGMIEVIQSDFARLEADTTASEGQAAQEYEQFMTDSKVNEKAAHKSAFDATMEKDRKEHAKNMNLKDLRGHQEELDAAQKYHEQLKPMCVEVKVSYEERVANRKAEIESLREALDILNEQ